MNEAELDTWDEYLVRASQSDGVVDFSVAEGRNGAVRPTGTPLVDPTLFKALYMGRALPGATLLPAAVCAHWRIKGGRFSGVIDLSDERRPDGISLPALEFEDCTFPEGFCADNCVIRRLKFSGCEFGTYAGDDGFLISIGLRNTRLEGDLHFERLKSTREDGVLTIAAPAMNVAGSVKLSDTVLTSPPDTRKRGEDRNHSAVELYEAEIRDDVIMMPRVVIRGGLSIRSARIGGQLSLGDMNVSDGVAPGLRKQPAYGLLPRFAIDGTGLSVAGNIFFQSWLDCERFTAEGAVWMYGFETKASLVLTGASFRAAGGSYALLLSSGKVSGDLIAQEETREGHKSSLGISGDTSLSGMSVGGRVELYGNLTDLDASRLRVGLDTTLSIRVSGNVNLDGADLKGQIDLSSFSFKKPQAGARSFFSLRDADVGHTLRLAGSARPLTFNSCRRTALLCYPGYQIFEIQFEEGIATILLKRGKAPVLLDGMSLDLHQLSSAGALDLNTPEAIRDYLRLFGAYVWGDDGAFAMVEGLNQLPAGSYPPRLAKILPEQQEIQLEPDLTQEDWNALKELIFEDPGEQPDYEEWARYRDELRTHGVLARSFVRHGTRLFFANFFILTRSLSALNKPPLKAGWVRVLSEFELETLRRDKLPIYDRPLVSDREPGASDYKSKIWKDVSKTELSLRIPMWPGMLEKRLARFQNASIDLTNASCRTLDDGDGRAWGADISSLYLENFVYININQSAPSTQDYVAHPNWLGKMMLRIYGDKEDLPQNLMKWPLSLLWLRTMSSSKEATTERRAWLARMPKNRFTHQPYTQLANVLRASGDDESAKVIEEKRISLAVKARSKPARGLLFWALLFGVLSLLVFAVGAKALLLAPVVYLVLRKSYRLSWAAFWMFFRYGLSPGRATRTVLFCLVVGWWGVNELNNRGYLVQNTSTAATLVEKQAGGDLEAVFPYAEKRAESSDLRCGPMVNGLLYATDVFIPLLDLRQESKCDIRSLHKGDMDPDKEWAAQKDRRRKVAHYLWAAFHSPVLWVQFAKSFYAILGWIVISLTILTYSGTLRRWGEK